MAAVERRYSKAEIARRGAALYDEKVRPLFEPSHNDQFAVIDIETGEFEVDVNELDACHRLRARFPKAQPWLVCIGSRYVRRFGFMPRKARAGFAVS